MGGPKATTSARKRPLRHIASETVVVTLEADVAAAFDLGTASSPLVLAASGWGGHNTVSRLVTSAGAWAVKRYGWRVPPRASDAVRIEAAAYLGGVPMARPMPTIDGRYWREIGGHLYRCHEWVEGEAKQNETTSAVDARAMGAVVAHVHALRIPVDPGAPSGTIDSSWEDLARAGLARDAPWPSDSETRSKTSNRSTASLRR